MSSEAFGDSHKLEVFGDFKKLKRMLKILGHLRDHPGQTGDALKKALDISPSDISDLVKTLNSFWAEPVIEPLYGRPYGQVTKFGEGVIDQLRMVGTAFSRLGDGRSTSSVCLGATNSIMLYVLPGAITAYNLLKPRLHPDHHVDLTVYECNHVDMIKRVADGQYDLGIGWETDWELDVKGVETSDPLFAEVPFTVMIPSAEVGRSALMRDRMATLDALFAGSETGVQIGDLREECITRNRKIAAIRSDPSLTLRSLISASNPINVTWVRRYDDALAFARSGMVDLAYAPIWYRDRRHVQHRVLLEESGKEFTRGIVIYRRTAAASRAHRQEVATFQEVVRKFCQDHKDLILNYARPGRGRKQPQRKLLPADIVRWAEAYTSSPSGRSGR